MPRTVIIDLDIPPDELARYYGGVVSQVMAVSRDGLRVQFPASHLRQFVDHGGVKGAFCLEWTEDNRLRRFERVDDGPG